MEPRAPAAYAALTWAVLFVVAHVYWHLGGLLFGVAARTARPVPTAR
jgi:hypothetical protein